MTCLLRMLWSEEEAQDVAEYAVMFPRNSNRHGPTGWI